MPSLASLALSLLYIIIIISTTIISNRMGVYSLDRKENKELLHELKWKREIKKQYKSVKLKYSSHNKKKERHKIITKAIFDGKRWKEQQHWRLGNVKRWTWINTIRCTARVNYRANWRVLQPADPVEIMMSQGEVPMLLQVRKPTLSTLCCLSSVNDPRAVISTWKLEDIPNGKVLWASIPRLHSLEDDLCHFLELLLMCLHSSGLYLFVIISFFFTALHITTITITLLTAILQSSPSSPWNYKLVFFVADAMKMLRHCIMLDWEQVIVAILSVPEMG